MSGLKCSVGCKCARHNKPTKEHTGTQYLWARLKIRCKKTGLELRLTKWDFVTLSGSPCFYCGDWPNQRLPGDLYRRHPDFRYTGIDRRDNAIGYIITNLVSCCWSCNRMKGTMAEADFIDQATKIAAHRDFQTTSKEAVCRRV